MKSVFDSFVNQFGSAVDIVDSQGELKGLYRALKLEEGASTRFGFSTTPALSIEPHWKIRLANTMDTYDITDIGRHQGGIIWCFARSSKLVESPSQSLTITGSNISQLNVAGRDLHVTNRDVLGPEIESPDRILDEMRQAVESDDKLQDADRVGVLQNINDLRQELAKPTPRAEYALKILAHLSTIATLVQPAHAIGLMLAAKLFPGM